jgi:DNA polymerase III epsilon subunit family exonuclease
MFQDVLFPPLDQDQDTAKQSEAFRLRRLKRFIPEPQLPVCDATIVVFDLETTGLDFEVDRIIEIGAVKLKNWEPVAEFSFLVRTDLELTDDIIKLTGITPAMLVGQPDIATVLPQFFEFIEGSLLVAHNAEFDLGMVKAAASRLAIDLEWPCFCTLKMARELLPALENKKLDTLAQHYGLTFESRHRSIGDVKVTCGVLKGLLAREAAALQTWSHLQPFTAT